MKLTEDNLKSRANVKLYHSRFLGGSRCGCYYEKTHKGLRRRAAALAVLFIRVQDPVKVDAKHYKVEAENDHVRVLRIQ